MPSSEKFAIAAHLHVLLRRKTGRITDTEWLAGNQEYAAEITRFAREKARDEGNADLSIWADKLEKIMQLPDAGQAQRVPLVKLVSDALRGAAGPALSAGAGRGLNPDNHAAETQPEAGFLGSAFGPLFGEGESGDRKKPRDPDAPRYVKGLR